MTYTYTNTGNSWPDMKYHILLDHSRQDTEREIALLFQWLSNTMVIHLIILLNTHDDVIKWKPSYWPFVRESLGHRCILLKKASEAKLWFSLWCAPEQTLSKKSGCWWFETPLRLSWRHYNYGQMNASLNTLWATFLTCIQNGLKCWQMCCLKYLNMCPVGDIANKLRPRWNGLFADHILKPIFLYENEVYWFIS